MKLINVFILLLIIQGTIVLYDGVFATGGEEGYALVPYGANDSTIWNLLANPVGWSTNDFLKSLLGLTTLAAAIGIGVSFFSKSDTVLFFSVFISFLGFASIPIISLYGVFTKNIADFGCTTMSNCPQVYFAWVFTGGILVLITVMSILAWWSNRSMK